jgi:hypothetical protein
MAEESLAVQEYSAFAFRALPFPSIARIVTAMILDQKIVIVAHALGHISTFCYSLLALIHPLPWSGAFIPVLPSCLSDTLYAPFPFIIGLHSSLSQATTTAEMESHLLVDLDRRHLTDVSPEFALPVEVSRIISNFEGFTRQVGATKAVSTFISSLIESVIGKIADPSTLPRWFELANKATDPSIRSYANAILQSRSITTLVREAEAGPGSEIWWHFWGKSGTPPIPRREGVHGGRPAGFFPNEEIARLADLFGKREVSIDSVLEDKKRRAQSLFVASPEKLSFRERLAIYQTKN